MPATGQISTDLSALRELIVEDTDPVTLGTWPWPPPSTSKAIQKLTDHFGSIPADVADLYRVTSRLTAGYFVDLADPALVLEAREHAGETVEMFAPLAQPPVSAERLMWLQMIHDCSVGIVVDGPDEGRIYSPDWGPDIRWSTLAWSLGDAIACTRELYEAGWWGPSNPLSEVSDTAEFERICDDVVEPILARWSCNSMVARLRRGRFSEPERPTGR